MIYKYDDAVFSLLSLFIANYPNANVFFLNGSQPKITMKYENALLLFVNKNSI